MDWSAAGEPGRVGRIHHTRGHHVWTDSTRRVLKCVNFADQAGLKPVSRNGLKNYSSRQKAVSTNYVKRGNLSPRPHFTAHLSLIGIPGAEFQD